MHDPRSVRQQLREATHPAHARVDALLRDGLADAPTYAGYLAGMHGFLGAVREALPDVGADLLRLRDDLATVGVAPPPLPPPVRVAPAERLAWRYVVDGSALGARVLLRQATALGHDALHGATFLAHHAAGDAWDATCRALDALPLDASHRLALCAAADRAFASAYDALLSGLDTHRSPRSA